jgi:hypothetical protein
MALCSFAKALITVNMVVPVSGNFDFICMPQIIHSK